MLLITLRFHRFFSGLARLAEGGTHRMAVAPLLLLLPLSLGLPLAIWLAGGRGSAAVSCLLMSVWRTIFSAVTGDQCPSASGKPSLVL